MLPPQVDGVLRDVRPPQPETNQRQRKGGVHQQLFERRAFSVSLVEADRVGVDREQREPDVVDIGDRAPQRVGIDIATVKSKQRPCQPDLRWSIPEISE